MRAAQRAGVAHLRLVQDGYDFLGGQLLAFDELRQRSAYFLEFMCNEQAANTFEWSFASEFNLIVDKETVWLCSFIS